MKSDSMSLKTTKFDKMMLGKGFVNDQTRRKNNSHLFFYLEYPKGVINSHIKTFRSVHSNQSDIADVRVKDMAKQLHFEKKKDFDEYLECNYSFDRYIEHLKKENLFPLSEYQYWESPMTLTAFL